LINSFLKILDDSNFIIKRQGYINIGYIISHKLDNK